MTSLSLVLLLEHDPLVHKHLFCSIVFERVGEYSKTTHTLAPFSSTPTSFETTLAFVALHFNLDGYFLFFLEDYELD